MKVRITYFLISIFLLSCSGPKEPEFKRVENVLPIKKSKLEYTLTADIIMNNPNPIGAKLMKTDLDILVNNVEVGKAKQRLYTKIDANSEFSIPVSCNFSAKDLLKNQGNSIEGILNAIADNKVDLQYKGTVRLKIAGMEFDVPVNYEQEVKLK